MRALWRRLSPTAADLLIAALAVVAVCVETLAKGDDGSPLALQLLFAAGLGAPLALRRRAPRLAVVLVFGVGTTALQTTGAFDEMSTPFLVICMLAYGVGAHAGPRAAVQALGLGLVGVAVLAASFSHHELGDFVFPMGFFFAAWGIGRTVTHRARLTEELHEAAVRAREEREAEQAQAVADERRRIAREMHDVVAHSVSVMVVQAGGARRILDRDPERAEEAARRIEETGRAALVEMRRLLGVLHPGEHDPALDPQPTLDGLDGLVRHARSAGMEVDVVVEGERRPLPAGAEVAAYRIVQEALTNTLKHAGGAPATVRLRWLDDAVELQVVDRGATATPRLDLPSGSHGIVGMRERVRVYGGELQAGPRTGGGFEVRARLPLRREEVAA